MSTLSDFNWYMMVLLKDCSERPFFQNGRHMVKISTLSDLNENWYLGVYWGGDHDSTMEKLFFSCNMSFLSDFSMKKWLPFSRIGFQVSDIVSSRANMFQFDIIRFREFLLFTFPLIYILVYLSCICVWISSKCNLRLA